MLERMKNEKDWDIIIIGGGATGLGAAVDAASRGYRTLLVEAYDFAKGTSSRSTKLVHGGVRYLEQGNIKLVREALRERGWLLQNAPHITTAIPFVLPVYSVWQKLYYGIGLSIYDTLSAKLSLGKTKWLSKQKTLEYLPGLSAENLSGGIVYYDGQFDDARLAIDLAKTAASHGAVVINYCKAAALIKTKNKITGIIAKDTLSGESYELKARAVINATGVFTDEVLHLDNPTYEPIVSPSQGIHIVVDKSFFPGGNALLIPKTEDNRVLFAVPWHNKVVIGTTDTPVQKTAMEPKPLEEEINFVIHHANKYFKQAITRKDVASVFAGLRPLVKNRGTASTAALSRDHVIIVSTTGLITITGGKWTTYRKMAEDAVDNAAFVGKLPRRLCLTKKLPIASTENGQTNISGNKILHAGFVITDEDVEYFVTEEMAMTVEDVLARRTRLLFLDARSAKAKAKQVAEKIAKILLLDELWVKEQVKQFNALTKQYTL
jgi:glycerol-3-phosphate dehydrogenase